MGYSGSSTSLMFWCLLLLTIFHAGAKLISEDADDVPMHKAMPPLMDPIPTLPEITHRVYFDVTIDGESAGQIVFGLFGTLAPKTVENFVALSSCTHGNGAISGKPLCYKNSIFHRIIPDFMIQGGDFTHFDGTGGESIFEGNHFKDESFEIKHNRRYMLAMSNRGRPNSNGSQFYINTVKAGWLDGANVIFGMVLHGTHVVKEIERHGTYGGTPKARVVITDCGTQPLEPEDKEVHY